MMKKPLLVIIDDEPDSLDLLRYNFNRKGYEVMTFVDPSEAWEFINRERPDMILCDGNLTEAEGHSFCEKVKRSPTLSHIPVVMLSYRSDKLYISKTLEERGLRLHYQTHKSL